MTAKPLNLLTINASGRRNESVTRMLTAELTDVLKEKTAIGANALRDLAEGVPLVDERWIAANFTPPEERSPEQTATLSFSDSLVRELQDADLILIGAPIYNFSIPAALKAWIDQVARARLTFRYTENGPEGLLRNKTAIVVFATGGTEIGSDIDFASGYLKHVLGFIGIDDVIFVAADRLMTDAEGALEKAREEIANLASELPSRSAQAA